MKRKQPRKAKQPKRKAAKGTVKRATNAVFWKRVREVLRVRLAGAEFHDLREYAQQEDAETGRPWDVSDGQLWRYIREADDLLAQQLEADAGRLLGLHHARRQALYARAVETGDLRTALAVLRDSAELTGLYPAKKIDMATTAQLTIVEEIVDADPHPDDPPAPPPAGVSPE